MRSRWRIAAAGAAALVMFGAAGAVAIPMLEDQKGEGGVRYILVNDNVTASAPLTIDVPCPGTKQPTGGGQNPGLAKTDLTRAAYPVDLSGDGRMDAWRVVYETKEIGNVGTTGFVFCRGGDHTYVKAKGTLPSGEPGNLTLTAMCPAGQQITGGGAMASSPAGAQYGAEVTSSFPIDGADADTKPDDGWRARFFGTAQPGTKVYAICATSTQKYVRADLSISGMGSGQAVLCPADRHIVGVGGKIDGVDGLARVTGAYSVDAFEGQANDDPFAVPDDNASVGFNNEMDEPVARPASVWAICA